MKSSLKNSLPFFLLAILFCGCSSTSNGPTQGFERLFPVAVSEVKVEDVPIYIEAIGNVASSVAVQIRPQVSGKVIDAPIKAKIEVQAGDLLYRIDPLPYKLELEKAKATLLKDQAELEYAKKKVERYETLVKKDFVSKLNLEEFQRDVKALEAQIEIDKAQVGTALTNLNYCNIYSPIPGRVSIQSIEIGNLVAPNDSQPMATILQLIPIDINFSIPQKDFEELQHVLAEGNKSFKVILPGTNQEFLGEIVAIDNQVDLKTGTIQIKGSVPNHDKILWPGEFVRVHVFIKQLKNALLVPYAAVQVGQQGPYVYILNPDQTVTNVGVEVGQRVGDRVVIEKGIEQGMKIVTDGQINLRPGAKVIVTGGQKEPK